MSKRKTAEQSTVEQSVVIPTNSELLRLRWVLEGLARQVTGQPWELIVVADTTETHGEADCANLKAMLQEFAERLPNCDALRLAHLPFKSDANEFRAGQARNMGIKLARGRQVLFLDQDCIPGSDWLESHGAFIGSGEKDGTPGKAAFGMRRLYPQSKFEEFHNYFDLNGMLPYTDGDARQMAETVFAANWFSCNASAPRAALLEVGGFDESYGGAWGSEDMDLGRRLKRHGVEVADMRTCGGVIHLDHPHRHFDGPTEAANGETWEERKARTFADTNPIVANGGPLQQLGYEAAETITALSVPQNEAIEQPKQD